MNDGSLLPRDALTVLNVIGRHRTIGSGRVDVETLRQSGVIDDLSGPFHDVNGDGEITPLDALQVLVAINRGRALECAGSSTAAVWQVVRFADVAGRVIVQPLQLQSLSTKKASIIHAGTIEAFGGLKTRRYLLSRW